MNSITAIPPSLAKAVVADAVLKQFSLAGDYVELVSERDQNFRLKTDDGDSYVVKVTSLVQDKVVTDFQISALLHLESRRIVGVPRVVRTVKGDDRGEIGMADGSIACLRVVTWLDGHLLDDCPLTPLIASRLGQRMAQLDIALQDFAHPGEAQDLLWDTQRASELRDLLVHVDDAEVHALLTSVLDDFDTRVRPALASLPAQVIHNDAHGENILINSAGEISGIIDFGDMLRAPRIIELSTAAAYLRDTGADPLGSIASFVESYHSVNPLASAELDLLFDLTRTRLMMTIVLFYWRLSARSADDPYRQKLLQNEGDAVDFLQTVTSVGRDGFRQRCPDKSP